MRVSLQMLTTQTEIFTEAESEGFAGPKEAFNLRSYDHYIIGFSGGKDSISCFLNLLDQGVPVEKIELWHHEIDGREGARFEMDWPYVPAYCRRFAAEFGVKIYFSWKEGGFAGEMLRDDRPTAPTRFELPDGTVGSRGGQGPNGTRGLFPQVSADLRVRWCSSYLKIDVMAAALRAQDRFNGKRTLVITGERAQESDSRANYKEWEVDRTDSRKGRLRRHVDHWRPIHKWSEQEVWNALRRHRVIPPPTYRLGWGRLSCLFCVFGNCNQWASAQSIAPGRFEAIAREESGSGKTIQRKLSVRELAEKGSPYAKTKDPELVEEVLNKNWSGAIRCESDEWTFPAGAFGESSGPS